MPGNTRIGLLILGLLALAAAMGSCGPTLGSNPSPSGPGNTIALPQPDRSGETSLEELLARRRSVREFDALPLTQAELGQLLWAAQGVTNERAYRTAPSAGALYPLEVYMVTAQGVYQYDPACHCLVVSSLGDARPALYQAALRQEPVRLAPAVFVVTAIHERTISKYGPERGPRYVHLEAGHSAQNLLLQAEALELGAVPIGAFDDQEIQKALGLSPDHAPLYLIPVGHPVEPKP